MYLEALKRILNFEENYFMDIEIILKTMLSIRSNNTRNEKNCTKNVDV